ncbi:hypothetical protein AMECASPLE_034497 [Ameca splendens]|uniref:Uncharacterized protein n=1 Tax=Ameca splendens TaxID=208324 RepID=A0ABV0ZSD6_9TELE
MSYFHQFGKGYKAIPKILELLCSILTAIIQKWRKHGRVLHLPRSGKVGFLDLAPKTTQRPHKNHIETHQQVNLLMTPNPPTAKLLEQQSQSPNLNSTGIVFLDVKQAVHGGKHSYVALFKKNTAKNRAIVLHSDVKKQQKQKKYVGDFC